MAARSARAAYLGLVALARCFADAQRPHAEMAFLVDARPEQKKPATKEPPKSSGGFSSREDGTTYRFDSAPPQWSRISSSRASSCSST